jgi:CRP/FNR family cyclic AMP-dependent transcriptional regulator
MNCPAHVGGSSSGNGGTTMDMPHRETFLAQTGLLSGLELPVLAGVASAVTETTFAAGQSIFVRGDAGNTIFMVIEGRVRLSILTSDGRELSFAHAVAGDTVGEIAAIDGSPRSADATALTPVRALVLPAARLKPLINEHPALGWAFMRFLCGRLRDVSDHLEDIALLPIEARLARFLLVRLGPAKARPAGATTIVSLGMSQSELALLLGASRQKVNGALTSLEHTGAIVRTGEGIRCDPGVLEQIARRD